MDLTQSMTTGGTPFHYTTSNRHLSSPLLLPTPPSSASPRYICTTVKPQSSNSNIRAAQATLQYTEITIKMTTVELKSTQLACDRAERMATTHFSSL